MDVFFEFLFGLRVFVNGSSAAGTFFSMKALFSARLVDEFGVAACARPDSFSVKMAFSAGRA